MKDFAADAARRMQSFARKHGADLSIKPHGNGLNFKVREDGKGELILSENETVQLIEALTGIGYIRK